MHILTRGLLFVVPSACLMQPRKYIRITVACSWYITAVVLVLVWSPAVSTKVANHAYERAFQTCSYTVVSFDTRERTREAKRWTMMWVLPTIADSPPRLSSLRAVDATRGSSWRSGG